MIIYKATSPSGKSYIGQTSQPFNKRKKEHEWKCNNRVSDVPFYKALRKYGFEKFTWEVLATVHEGKNRNRSLDALNRLEKGLIELYDTLSPNGYNLKLGGNNTQSFTTEVRRRMSAAQTGEKNAMYGRYQSQETKKKISEALKGRKLPDDLKCKGERNGMYGKKHTEESKRKISQSLRRIKQYYKRKEVLTLYNSGTIKAADIKQVAKSNGIDIARSYIDRVIRENR